VEDFGVVRSLFLSVIDFSFLVRGRGMMVNQDNTKRVKPRPVEISLVSSIFFTNSKGIWLDPYSLFSLL
jgi:hypothetical protein